ncbi:MAG: L,D-transpeptidase family protein [Patescibacteria group bacterium]
MLKKILTIRLPLWFVFLVLILTTTASVFVQLIYFKRVADYKIVLSGKNGDFIPFEYGARPAMENINFFNATKNKLIADKINFIEADLSAMKLKIYKDGSAIKEVAILTKGKEGSWWETPAGFYKIESKEKNHFSSFGRVYQPWSLAFQGNFFIHGWPYYPDGTPVASGYSGGCIRLSSEDAEEIFNLAEKGMPVLVFDKKFESDDFNHQRKTLNLAANNYLAADIKNNFVFLEKSSDNPAPVASIAKLITALVASEYINLEKNIVIEKKMIVKTSLPRLKPGQKISVFNLLYPLLLESSNEAAQALADSMGRNYFVGLMNNKAKSLGMKSAKFVDPAGSESENISTAKDLFNLSKYIYNNRLFIFKITGGNLNNTAYGKPSFADLKNFNVFGDDPSFIGGKIGKTEAAGETMLAVFELEFNGAKRPVAIIVLGSLEVEKDVLRILNYLKNNY